MRWYRSAYAALLFLAVAVLPLRGQHKDPADLLPEKTLAYVEVRRPDLVSKDIMNLLKGSGLENIADTLAKFRKEHPNANDFWTYQQIGLMSVTVSPEILQEATRLEGAAFALTGFGKDHEPEIVGFILAGESNFPTFVLRGYLSTGEAQSCGEVEKIQLYRERPHVFSRIAPGQAEPPPPEDGTTFALLPKAVVIGSNMNSVKEVVRRFMARDRADVALSKVAAFREAGKLRDRPGLFAYADIAALANEFEGSNRKGRPFTDYEWSVMKAVVNPKAFRTVAASLSAQNGDLDLQIQVGLDAKQQSPLLEILSDKPVAKELLHAVPSDSIVTLAMSLPEGEKRWDRVVQVADAIAKVGNTPEEFRPSKIVAGMEKEAKFKFGKDVFGKITGIALALNLRGEGAAANPSIPMLVLKASDASAAVKLEEAVPAVVGLVSKAEVAAPTRETILGQRISALPGDSVPWRSPLFYGRTGDILVFGSHRQAVAEGLVGALKKGGLLDQPKVADALRGHGDSVVLGTWSLGETIVQSTKIGASAAMIERPLAGGGAPGGLADTAALEKFIRAVTKVTEQLQPASIAVTRAPDRLFLEIRQAALQSVSSKLIDIAIQQSLEDAYKRGGGVLVKPAPQPAAPFSREVNLRNLFGKAARPLGVPLGVRLGDISIIAYLRGASMGSPMLQGAQLSW